MRIKTRKRDRSDSEAGNAPKRRKIDVEDDDVDDEVTLKPPSLRRSPNGYILPPPLPSGLVVRDSLKRRWTVGRSIGVGGFGEIYTSCMGDDNEENYVIKVEPHTNGPLFVEINFYVRCAKSADLSHFRKTNRFKHLGVPDFVASGSFRYMNNRYRFLVLPRLGDDLDKMLERCGGYFEEKTARNLAIQVLNSLEYVHSCGFVHKDIKSSNLLLDRSDRNRIFLADFGLASKYVHHGVHKPFVEDVRWAHEGTLEYTSRDAHAGCPSRRGDIEVLFYNLIEWLGGRLPWDMSDLQKPSFYKNEKLKAFEDPLIFLDSSFGVDGYPDFLLCFMKLIKLLRFAERPDYDEFRRVLRRGPSSSPLRLSFVKMPDQSLVTFRTPANSNQENIKPPNNNNNNNIDTRRFDKKIDSALKRPSLSYRINDRDDEYEAKRRERMETLIKQSWENPTPVMLEVLALNKNRKWKKSSRRSCSRTSMTPAMEAVIKMKENKKKKLRTKKLSILELSLKKIENRSISCGPRHNPSQCRELTSLKRSFKNGKVITRSHSVPNTTSITSRSLRKQVRDALRLGLGSVGEFLKSFYPFNRK